MKKLSEDELLVMASEKMEMDLLEKPCPYHKFSRDYESRRKVLCDQVRRPDKHLKYWSFSSAGRKWTAAKAVLVMVSAVSVTAYAYYRNLVMNAKQDENYVSVELSESVAAEEDMEHSLENLPEQGIEVPKVNLAVGYVPEGFMAVADRPGYYAVDGDLTQPGFWVKQNFEREMGNRAAGEYENITIGNMQAVLVRPMAGADQSLYAMNIYLLNPEDMVSIWIGSDSMDISEEELIRIAESVTYESSGQMQMAYDLRRDDQIQTQAAAIYDGSQVSDSFFYGEEGQTGISIGVQKIEFLDNVSGLDAQHFYDAQALKEWTDEGGQIKDVRSLETEENHKITLDQYATDQKLMLVTLEINNAQAVDVEDLNLNQFGVIPLQADAGGQLHQICRGDDHDLLGYGEVCYVDSPEHTQGEDRTHSFASVSVPAGETKTVTIGIGVYAEDMPNAYLSYNPRGVDTSGEFSAMLQLYDLSRHWTK